MDFSEADSSDVRDTDRQCGRRDTSSFPHPHTFELYLSLHLRFPMLWTFIQCLGVGRAAKLSISHIIPVSITASKEQFCYAKRGFSLSVVGTCLQGVAAGMCGFIQPDRIVLGTSGCFFGSFAWFLSAE